MPIIIIAINVIFTIIIIFNSIINVVSFCSYFHLDSLYNSSILGWVSFFFASDICNYNNDADINYDNNNINNRDSSNNSIDNNIGNYNKNNKIDNNNNKTMI